LYYLSPVKRFLNKTLSVKQVILLVAIPPIVTGAIMRFTSDSPSQPKLKASNDSTVTIDSVPTEIDTTALGRLLAYVDSLNRSPELQGGGWSFYLKEVNSDSHICAVDIDRGFVPASVMKVVTTGTALAVLGPNYHYSTSLQYDGVIENRVLNGNIYIRGGGDPTLGAADPEKLFASWAVAVKNLGIDSIAGCVIGDAECFERDPVPGGWAWEDINSDYGASPCGLNIRENTFDMMLTPGANGVSIKTSPFIPGMKLYNQVVKGGGGKSYAYVTGGPYQFERTALGEVSAYTEVRSNIPDPALFCAQGLKTNLSQYGIGLRDSATTLRLMRLNGLKSQAKEGRKTISSVGSASLSQLVYHTNQISQNFYAETFLKTLSMKERGYGSTYGGVGVVYDFWRSKGVDLRGMCMVDGSGLSRNNSLTTHQLGDMLQYIAKDSSIFRDFYKSLPVAGESGTIRKLADSTLAEGNVHAKSGTMSRVRAYAGYVHSRSGKLMCFAVVGNNTQWDVMQLRDKFERLFVLMAELP
jgi:serine-type D-Ala-D-Ala carboxypeptidase/endopeptidase (penicillin-binding protein 4)